MHACLYISLYICINNLDGSHKSVRHHSHHTHPSLSRYASFYPEMIVQASNESFDLEVAAALDKERQNIENSLSTLAPPIVRISSIIKNNINSLFVFFFLRRFKILKVEVR